ncbi:MAG: PilZ domain-containing protein [Deltaproteobacteria bacterium]|nr:PilZ domain-containing protein [Deltaproteobacteria bacterium]
MSSDDRGKDRRQQDAAVEVERRQGDRRRWKRIPVEIWGEASDGEATYFHQAADLSAGGVFFTGAIPQPVGTVVKIKLELPGVEPLTVNGVVVNTGGGVDLGMGVQFTDLSDEERARIDAVVESD